MGIKDTKEKVNLKKKSCKKFLAAFAAYFCSFCSFTAFTAYFCSFCSFTAFAAYFCSFCSFTAFAAFTAYFCSFCSFTALRLLQLIFAALQLCSFCSLFVWIGFFFYNTGNGIKNYLFFIFFGFAIRLSRTAAGEMVGATIAELPAVLVVEGASKEAAIRPVFLRIVTTLRQTSFCAIRKSIMPPIFFYFIC